LWTLWTLDSRNHLAWFVGFIVILSVGIVLAAIGGELGELRVRGEGSWGIEPQALPSGHKHKKQLVG